MEAKRLRDEPDDDRDSAELSGNKRMRTIPSRTTVLREVLAAKSLQNIVAYLEPVFRRVVQEEVERRLVQAARSIQRPPSKQIHAVLNVSTALKLVFSNGLGDTIFTGSKIEDKDNNPLRLFLVDTTGGSTSPVRLQSPVRIEVLVLDGDFPGDRDGWTSEEFDRKIVKEREGKRPLLTGDVLLTLRDGSSTIGELTFTDNSSWIRSRRFRLGARVATGSSEGLKVREAMTEAFMVKDHRGELYRKHYPPALHDEVWRLEGIGKDGAFHKKLQGEHINTVQDFLKLSVVDPERLRAVLGPGKSDKTWEGTLNHARQCTMGNKLYVHRLHQHVLLLNPICQVQGIVINGHPYPPSSLKGPHPAYLRQLVVDAYTHWDRLEEIDDAFGGAALQNQSMLLPQIAMGSPSPSSSITYQPSHEESLVSTFHNGVFDTEDFHGHVEVEFSGWIPNSAFTDTENY